MPPHGHAATGTTATATDKKSKSFVQEMKVVAIKMHTREQAPKGEAKSNQAAHKFEPTREGYLSFLVESKVVFDTLEGIMAEAPNPSYVNFQNTGLERSSSLEKDIAELTKDYSLEVPVATADGPGQTYAALLKKLATDDPPAFMCHFYNQYFAHSAGGRMIGKKVSDMLLDGKLGAFYQYDGNMGDSLEKVRKNIDATAEGWDREQKDHCLEETSKSFQYGGALLKCMMGAR
jgi:heme oxygenase